MPPFEIELAIILRTLNDDAHIAEALFFPEVSRYGDDPERLKRAIIRNCVRMLEEESPNGIFRRTLPTAIETSELNLQLEPPHKRLTWRNPIDLRLDVIRWSHGEHAHIAFIPALGIEVISTKLDDLMTVSESHARAELMRRRATNNLLELIMLERSRDFGVARVRSMATIRTPKQIAASGQHEEKKVSVLEQTAHDLTTQKFSPAYEVDDAVARLAEALSGKSGRSVLLVGKAGVGKTAVFNELVRRRAECGLGSTSFWSTSGSRLVAGMSGYGMWQERCDALWREAEKTNAVVHFGNLVELMDTGKHEHNAQGLASFFRQRFMRSQALAVVECTLEQLPLIEHEDPALLRVFVQLTVDEPTIEAGRRILTQVADNYARASAIKVRREWRRQVRAGDSQTITSPITEAGLDTLDRLHRRYAGYSAYPGRPLRFLRGLLQDRATAFTQDPPLAATFHEHFHQLSLDDPIRWHRYPSRHRLDAADFVVDVHDGHVGRDEPHAAHDVDLGGALIERGQDVGVPLREGVGAVHHHSKEVGERRVRRDTACVGGSITGRPGPGLLRHDGADGRFIEGWGR